MRRILLLLFAVALLLALAVPAVAIVDLVTPIACEGDGNGANAASGGAAGGGAAFDVVKADPPAVGPLFPARGFNSSLCTGPGSP